MWECGCGRVSVDVGVQSLHCMLLCLCRPVCGMVWDHEVCLSLSASTVQ